MEHCTQEVKIGAINEQIKTLFETVKKQDGIIKTMYDLTVEIRGLTYEMKTFKEDIGEVKCDVAELKNKPAKRWDSLVGQTITFIVGAVLAYIAARIGA